MPIKATEGHIASGCQGIACLAGSIVGHEEAQTATLQCQPCAALAQHPGNTRGTNRNLFAGHDIGAGGQDFHQRQGGALEQAHKFNVVNTLQPCVGRHAHIALAKTDARLQCNQVTQRRSDLCRGFAHHIQGRPPLCLVCQPNRHSLWCTPIAQHQGHGLHRIDQQGRHGLACAKSLVLDDENPRAALGHQDIACAHHFQGLERRLQLRSAHIGAQQCRLLAAVHGRNSEQGTGALPCRNLQLQRLAGQRTGPNPLQAGLGCHGGRPLNLASHQRQAL